jgi:CRP-like cAMP-binding protein
MTVLEDGTAHALGIWGPDDVVGLPLSTIEPYELECLSAVEATSVPTHLWQVDSSALIMHNQRLEELMLIRSYRKVDLMMLKLFSWLASRFGRDVDTGQLIDLRLTHQDIAEILGTTRVTVTRILSQLEQQGLIQRLRLHRIVLKEYETWHYEI